MSNTWNFKIDLKDENVFEKLASLYKTDFPSDLKEFIIESNGSNPEKNLVAINGVERVFEAVLSYNEDETETMSVFSVIEHNHIKSAIPFGMDPFGNLFFYSFEKNTVVFYNHEENRYENTGYSFTEFIESLY